MRVSVGVEGEGSGERAVLRAGSVGAALLSDELVQLAPRQQLGEQLELLRAWLCVRRSEEGFGHVVGLRGQREVVFEVAGVEVEGVGNGPFDRVEFWVRAGYVCTWT